MLRQIPTTHSLFPNAHFVSENTILGPADKRQYITQHDLNRTQKHSESTNLRQNNCFFFQCVKLLAYSCEFRLITNTIRVIQCFHSRYWSLAIPVKMHYVGDRTGQIINEQLILTFLAPSDCVVFHTQLFVFLSHLAYGQTDGRTDRQTDTCKNDTSFFWPREQHPVLNAHSNKVMSNDNANILIKH